MVAHLEQVHRPEPAEHHRFSGKAGVAGEECLEVAILEQQHERVLVDVLAPFCPSRPRMQDRDANAVELEMLTGLRRVPGNSVGDEPVQKAGVSRVGYVGTGLDDQARREARHYGRQAAEMIGVGMGNHRDASGTGHPAAGETASPPFVPRPRLRLRGRHPPGSSAPPACGSRRRRPALRPENVTRGSGLRHPRRPVARAPTPTTPPPSTSNRLGAQLRAAYCAGR